MVETASTPMRVPSPLSRPKAAFNGHTGFPPSIKINGESSSPVDSKSHQHRSQENHEPAEYEDDAIGQDPDWEPEVYNMGMFVSRT